MVDRAVMQAAEQGATAQEIEALVRNAVTDVTEGMMSDEDIAEEIPWFAWPSTRQPRKQCVRGIDGRGRELPYGG